MVIQHLINGILLGGVYACIGTGFSLVYGVAAIINLAHGSLIMLGSYIAYTGFIACHIDPFLGLPIVAAVMFIFGYLLQAGVINRVLKYGFQMVVVVTFGIDMILINVVMLIWSSDFRAVLPRYAGDGFQFGNLTIPYVRLGIFLMSVLVTILLYFFLQKTRIGFSIRATSINIEAARLFGIDINRSYAFTFGIASALAGIAGALFSPVFSINPFMGMPFLGKAFAVAVLGGLGNVTGAVVGGLVLGLAEAIGGSMIDPQNQSLVSYVILILVLIVRPHGILGRRFYQ